MEAVGAQVHTFPLHASCVASQHRDRTWGVVHTLFMSIPLSSFWPVDFLRNFFSQTLGLGTQKERLLDELTLEGVSRYMQSERCEFPALGPFLRDSPYPHFFS